MAITPRKLADGRTVYWISFRHNGERVFERVGFDLRAAERLHEKRKAERKAGTFVADRVSPLIKNGQWFARYLPTRTNRAAELDRNSVRDHVLSREWFRLLGVAATRPRDIERLVKEIRAAGVLGEKSITNVMSVVSQAFKRAVFEEIRSDNPCAALPKGTLKRNTSKRRVPYLRAEVRQLLACEDVLPSSRVWNHLAFYTGMREGEICGRRWRDWKRDEQPLGLLHVHSQYDDQPLKTDDQDGARPRFVPVHPVLAAVLTEWWETGFELVHCRRPREEDFIVPGMANRGARNISRSGAYTAFQRSLEAAKVENRTVHSTRHTFISVARSGTNRHDLVERITHNAKGTTLDDYTHEEWESLCEIVTGVDYTVDRRVVSRLILAPTQGLETRSESTHQLEIPGNPEERRDRVALDFPEGSGGNQGGVDASRRSAEEREQAWQRVMAALGGRSVGVMATGEVLVRRRGRKETRNAG